MKLFRRIRKCREQIVRAVGRRRSTFLLSVGYFFAIDVLTQKPVFRIFTYQLDGSGGSCHLERGFGGIFLMILIRYHWIVGGMILFPFLRILHGWCKKWARALFDEDFRSAL